MRNNTSILRRCVEYLRSLDNITWRDGDRIDNTLLSIGAVYIGQGSFSRVYRVGNVVIKFSTRENFTKLRPWLKNPFVKRYVPTVYWIHEKGYALLCKYVEYIRNSYEKHRPVQKRFVRLFHKLGLNTFDLHNDNLVRDAKTKRYVVIDYGCIITE